MISIDSDHSLAGHRAKVPRCARDDSISFIDVSSRRTAITATKLSSRAQRGTFGSAGRAVLLAFALVLIGIVAGFGFEAKAMPQAGVAVVQSASFDTASTRDGDRLVPCPFCGRLACPAPDDLLAAPSPDGAVLPASADPAPAVGLVHVLQPRGPPVPVTLFRALFEPRGPPPAG